MRSIISAMVVFFLLVGAVTAGINITDRTGDVKIAYPDGKVKIVKKSEEMPEVPSGCRIKIMSGSASVEAGEVKIDMDSGGLIQLWTNESSSIVHFNIDKDSDSGVKVTVGGNTYSVPKGGEIRTVLDEKKGTAEVKVVKGVAKGGGKVILAGESTKVIVKKEKEKKSVVKKKKKEKKKKKVEKKVEKPAEKKVEQPVQQVVEEVVEVIEEELVIEDPVIEEEVEASPSGF